MTDSKKHADPSTNCHRHLPVSLCRLGIASDASASRSDRGCSLDLCQWVGHEGGPHPSPFPFLAARPRSLTCFKHSISWTLSILLSENNPEMGTEPSVPTSSRAWSLRPGRVTYGCQLGPPAYPRPWSLTHWDTVGRQKQHSGVLRDT
jgi:hypothetical protein